MTAIISVIPILLLIVLMMGFKVSGYRSAVVTLIVTVALALFAVPSMGIMPEKFAEASVFEVTLWSVIEGLLKACFPIILIIIFAIFSSGGVLEGMAGFGTAVAIPAAILISLGFKPMFSAVSHRYGYL